MDLVSIIVYMNVVVEMFSSDAISTKVQMNDCDVIISG